MLKNYFKSAWRNLLKNKSFSIINISGLSLGLACSMLIALWVRDEYGVDAFHKNGDRLYIVTGREYSGGKVTYGGYDTPGPLGEEVKKVLPEVEYSCSMGWFFWGTFAAGEEVMKLPGNFASADFFKMFSYPIKVGSAETALSSPQSIVISERMAKIFFGSAEAAIDKSLRFNAYTDLKVTAVFEDQKDNVSDKFEYIISWEVFAKREGDWLKNWANSGTTAFVMLREHADPEQVDAKLRHFIKPYNSDYSEQDKMELGLQLFKEKYLHSNFKNGVVDGGRIESVQLFGAIAVFIMLLACINFMNLSTARSVKRTKEIGVRKVIGAVKTALVSQFMLEAFLLTTIAVVLSLVLMIAFLPQFNLLTGKRLEVPLLEGNFWLGLGALTMITALVAGSYPALFLSSFKPAAVFRGTVKVNSVASLFRKGLVVFQFALSIVFIIGMIIISAQVNYLQSKDLGYEKDNLIYVPLTGTIARNFDAFKNQAMQFPAIKEMSHISQRPTNLENSTGTVEWVDKAPGTKPVFVEAAVGYDFVKAMNATLVYGRDFSKDFADSSNYIINESALEIIGYKDPIGMPLTFWGEKGTIVGVVKDFHFNSLHVPIAPLVLRLQAKRAWGVALVRVHPSFDLKELEALHKKFNPDFPFNYQMADEEYAALYNREQVVKQLSRYFAFLAIFISSLGLLGLVIFTAAQRTKEIGIRKVLGSSVSQIATLLSKDFIKLIVVAILLASPIAYYAMNSWLSGFEYRVGIEWWVFVVAAGGSIAIALCMVSVHAIKAAMANPVESLKVE